MSSIFLYISSVLISPSFKLVHVYFRFIAVSATFICIYTLIFLVCIPTLTGILVHGFSFS
ncbi:hypothetical protein BKA63DRAFT_505038 [Paraphoma chrysanthemicola]|nr:hypothetical protein BKA63DRAFT_505038 [Paraphoma chrysanthemicola]